MIQNTHHVAILALSMMLVGLLCTGCGTKQEAEQPNIIVIIADDLGYNDLASYGQVTFPTPHTDHLAKQGMRLTRAYSPSAICSPTRYAVLTGTDPFRAYHHSHVLFNGEPLTIKKDELTIASLLKDKGYHTGIIGKWHLGLGDAMPRDINNPGRGPNDVGFDYAYIVPDGHNMYPRYYIENGMPSSPPDYQFHAELNILDRVGYKLLQQKPAQEWGNYRPDESVGRQLTEKATEFIKSNPAKPFFLILTTCSIHFPITPDPAFDGTSGIGPYGDFVTEFDWTVGEVMKTLDSSGLTNNTLLIVTSDNGGTRSVKGSDHRPSHPWRGHKETIWEGGSRVPFIARWPSKIPPATVSDEPVSLVDLFATVARITEAPLPETAALDSFDFLPVVTNTKNVSTRPFLVTGTRGMQAVAIRKNQWKLVFHQENNLWELYDLDRDPEESTDVSAEYPEKVDELKTLFTNYFESGASRPGAKNAGKPYSEILKEKDIRNNRINKIAARE